MDREDFKRVLGESMIVNDLLMSLDRLGSNVFHLEQAVHKSAAKIVYELENIRHVLERYHADNRSETEVLMDPDNNRFYESQEHCGTEPIDR